MTLLSTILTSSKRWLEKNSFEILPGSGIEIRGSPLDPTYRYILYWLSGKLTSKRPSLPPGKCFPKPFVNPCRFLIHFVGFSFYQFEWIEHTKDDELKLFWMIKKFWMLIYTKILEPMFVKHYAPNTCLPLNMAKFRQCRISTKIIGLCRKVKQVIYSSSPFQTASSHPADKVEMPFAKVHKSKIIWQYLFKR